MLEESNRTIDEVYDCENGQLITAYEFFKKPEHEIIHWRRALEESVLTGRARLICPYCKQMLKLCGKKSARGKVSYFSHLYDSDDCEIKTTTMQSREIIEARKYGMAGESERHNKLKHLIADALSTDRSRAMGISNVAVEQRINSHIPYMRWRRPDVQARYKEMNLVFELQLSTTFLSVVVDRDIFYRLNGWYIIWVFNFDDNKEYVNLHNLMCKDIYYANKRNIFIYDEKARDLSEKEGTLILRCQWLDADGRFTNGEYIKIDQLQYDTDERKPYFIDADEIYYKSHPDVKERLLLLENSRTTILDGIMERYECQLKKRREECERVERAHKEIISGTDRASIYENNGKCGFEYKGLALTTAIYDSIVYDETNQHYVLTRGKRLGYADRSGQIIVPCKFTIIENLRPNIYLVARNNEWHLLGSSTVLKRVSTTDSISTGDCDNGFWWIEFQYNRYSRSCVERFIVFPNQKTIPIRKCRNNAVSIENLNFNSHRDGYLSHTVDSNVAIRIYDNGLWGLYKNGMETIPAQYDKIVYLNTNEILIYRDNRMGMANIAGEIVIPVEFDNVQSLCGDCLKVSKSYAYGVYHISGCQILPVVYRNVNLISHNIFEIESWSGQTLKGWASKDGSIIVEPRYHKVIPAAYNEFIVQDRSDSPFAVVNIEDREIISLTEKFKQIVYVNGVYACSKESRNSNTKVDWKLFLRGNWLQKTIRANTIRHIADTFAIVDGPCTKSVYEYGRYESRHTFVCIDFNNIPISPSFDYVEKSPNGLIAGTFNGVNEYKVNENGQISQNDIILAPEVEELSQTDNGLGLLSFDSKIGVGKLVCGKITELLVPFEYDEIVFDSGYYICKISNCIEVYSSECDKLLPLSEKAKKMEIRPDGIISIIYDKYYNEWRHNDFSLFIGREESITHIGAFENGIADATICYRNGKIDANGKPVIEVCKLLPDGRQIVNSFQKFGMLDVNGDTVIPLDYDTLEVLPNGYIMAGNTIFDSYGNKLAVCDNCLHYLGGNVMYYVNYHSYNLEYWLVDMTGKKVAGEFSKISFKDNFIYTERTDYNERWSGRRIVRTPLARFGICDNNGVELARANYERIVNWPNETLLFINAYKNGVIVDLKSGDASEFRQVIKLPVIEGNEYYSINVGKRCFLIDASCNLLKEYAYIIADYKANVIIGTIGDGRRENAVTHEIIETGSAEFKVYVGGILDGTVSGVKRYGVFVKCGQYVGMVHCSRISGKPVKSYDYQIGQSVKVRVVNVKNDGKLDLEFV